MRIVRHDRGEIFLGFGVLSLTKSLFYIAPIKDHFLQFAFAASVADRTIERVISQKELTHRALGLFDLFTLCGDDHTVGALDSARGLELRHFVYANEAHTTRRLDLEILVIAKRRNAKAVVTAHVDQPCTRIGLKFLFVNGYFYLF